MKSFDEYLKNYEVQKKSLDARCDDARFLDVKELAFYLNCSEKVAYQIMHRPDFPLIKVGTSLRVNRKALIDWASVRRD